MTTQPGKQHDLHGSAPDTHDTALLLIDVINDFEFSRGDELYERALPMAPRIAELKKRARRVGIERDGLGGGDVSGDLSGTEGDDRHRRRVLPGGIDERGVVAAGTNAQR